MTDPTFDQSTSGKIKLSLIDGNPIQPIIRNSGSGLTDRSATKSDFCKFRKRTSENWAGRGVQTASACALKAACWERVTND